MSTIPLLDRLGHGLRSAALAAALGLAGCGGGGGGGDGVGSGGTGSYAAGPISGFGSVIVNGIRYDDSGAEVLDEDGTAFGSDDLRLGMVVEITGSAVVSGTGGSSASASTIRFSSEIVGPVEAKGADTLTVLGQTVEVTATTAYEDELAGGLAAIQVGDVLEVYAVSNGTGYIATRIERKGGTVEEYRLRGLVEALDTTAQTFRIGGTLISYATTPPDFTLAAGRLVRVRLDADRLPSGAYATTRLRAGNRQLEDRDDAEIEGLVGNVEPGGLRFTVDGIPVDATEAEFDDGQATDIVAGRRVEVEGRIEAGVLVAEEVEIEDDDGRSDDDDGAGGDDDDGGIELEGLVESLDATARSFVLRGLAVAYDDATGFDGGSATDLRNGAPVEVDGRLAADGVTVEALRIEFED